MRGHPHPQLAADGMMRARMLPRSTPVPASPMWMDRDRSHPLAATLMAHGPLLTGWGLGAMAI